MKKFFFLLIVFAVSSFLFYQNSYATTIITDNGVIAPNQDITAWTASAVGFSVKAYYVGYK